MDRFALMAAPPASQWFSITGSVLFVLNLRIDVVSILIKRTNQPLSPEASRAQFQRSDAKSVIG